MTPMSTPFPSNNPNLLVENEESFRMAMDAAKIGLKPGDLITGLAYTTFGGTA